MKEQIGRVEDISLGEYEVRYAPPATPIELGIEAERDRKLALNREPFSQMVSFNKKEPGDVIYLASFAHPFSGFHFGQLLNTVAPFKSPTDGLKRGILDDFEMPTAGLSTMTKNYEEYQRLRRIHEEDPEIGICYKRFVTERLESWTANLENKASDPIFHQLDCLRVLNDASVNPVFSNLLFSLRKQVYIETDISLLSKIFYSLNSNGDLHTAFIKFLREQPETQERKSRSDSDWDIVEYGYFPYYNLDNIKCLSRLIPRFLGQLDEPLKKDVVVGFIGRENATIVSVEDQKVCDIERDVTLSFADRLKLELSDKNGVSIEITLQKNHDLNSFYLDYYVSKYNFPQKFLQNAFYPTIAWTKNENGERRFISQEELEVLKAFIDLDHAHQADVYAGRVLLADFSPDIIDEWKTQIPLKHGRYPQEMMPAQVAVWVSLDSKKYPHAQQLLSHSNIQKLEAHMEKS